MKRARQRTYYGTAVLMISIIISLFVATEALAGWPTTVATRCWSIGSGMYMKWRITPTGGSFYNINGIIVSDGAIQNVMSGTAFVKGNLVYMTVSSSGKDSDAMWTSQDNIVIDKKTLIGQVEGIGHDESYGDGSLDTAYSGGPITFTPVACSSIWQ